MFDNAHGNKSQAEVYIAGAHSRAQTLRVYLEYLYPETKMVSYLVDDMSENQSLIDGIPVQLINTNSLQKDHPVYIATKGIYHPKIRRELEEAGFTDIIPVTVELDRQLREEYVSRIYQKQGRNYLKLDALTFDRMTYNFDLREKKTLETLIYGEAEKCSVSKTAAIYVAKSIFDQPLETVYTPICYEKDIQVGAALTRERLSEKILTDNRGQNISERNRQFCELTALYWIWKNAEEDVIGLVHYRRHFLLPEDWLDRMIENDVDVILPVPLYVAPSLADNYKSRHDPQIWNAMMQYLNERDRQEYEEAESFFQQNLYYPCNMFIMCREILDRLCKWLFPILFAVAERMGEKEDSYQNRYPGFLSERLITFFLEKSREEFKIVYADKNFLT